MSLRVLQNVAYRSCTAWGAPPPLQAQVSAVSHCSFAALPSQNRKKVFCRASSALLGWLISRGVFLHHRVFPLNPSVTSLTVQPAKGISTTGTTSLSSSVVCRARKMRPAFRPPNHLMAAAFGPSVAGGQFSKASVLSYLHTHT